MSAPDQGKVDPAKAPPKSESMASYEGGSWLGLTLLIGGGAVYVLGFVVGIVTMTPMTMIAVAGVSIVMVLAGGLILILKAVGDRMGSREDNYYSKNVDH